VFDFIKQSFKIQAGNQYALNIFICIKIEICFTHYPAHAGELDGSDVHFLLAGEGCRQTVIHRGFANFCRPGKTGSRTYLNPKSSRD
jgi:hypothetical protein